MTARTLVALLLVFILNSCSSAYNLRAVIIDGEVAFVPQDTDKWGNPDPDCFYSISVSIADGPAAKPGESEDESLVGNGVYWNKTFAVTSCENSFPITYGAKLRGPSFQTDYVYEVEAKPLLLGYTYEVRASSNGSAYGEGKFRLTEQGTVENLPL